MTGGSARHCDEAVEVDMLVGAEIVEDAQGSRQMTNWDSSFSNKHDIASSKHRCGRRRSRVRLRLTLSRRGGLDCHLSLLQSQSIRDEEARFGAAFTRNSGRR